MLILAVCAIASRFSTHPEINSKFPTAFLRGEEWAAPAREIALRRYDKPNITILTVLLILGLHEFGTCHGGRSWMFGGMAMRMAYALQLHKELDHDQLDPERSKDPKFSATDREIRRRVMWSCFLMDRFNSSGTGRPTCGSEEQIKVQLPIKESYFQMEIPGSTEGLAGDVLNLPLADAGQHNDPKQNMGVASYMVRAIALWGRVIRYLNLGGNENDPHPMWDQRSHHSELQKQLEGLKTSLPPDLWDTKENLVQHAADRLANQFLFMHIVHNQIALFLHRYAVPTFAKLPSDTPKDVVAESAKKAVSAANRISEILNEGTDRKLNAPFAGYCAYSSSTIHIWGMFSKNPKIETTAKQNLSRNIKYLNRMKKYWGWFHFLTENLKEVYRQHADASSNGLKAGGKTGLGATDLFQYGDWFEKYPNGVSKTDYEDPAAKIKEEIIDDAALSQKSDLQSVGEFFSQNPPPTKPSQHFRKHILQRQLSRNPNAKQPFHP